MMESTMDQPKQDHASNARLLLAGIEGDLRTETDKLRQIQTAGTDHFRHALRWVKDRGLAEGNVDAYCREMAGVACVSRV